MEGRALATWNDQMADIFQLIRLTDLNRFGSRCMQGSEVGFHRSLQGENRSVNCRQDLLAPVLKTLCFRELARINPRHRFSQIPGGIGNFAGIFEMSSRMNDGLGSFQRIR